MPGITASTGRRRWESGLERRRRRPEESDDPRSDVSGDCHVGLAHRAVVSWAGNPNRDIHVRRLILRSCSILILSCILAAVPNPCPVLRKRSRHNPTGDITEKSGFDRQFHCQVHVSGSSCAVEEEAAAGRDAGVQACAPEVVLGAAVVAMGAELAPAPVALAADVTAADMFTCVTGPLSPGLPIRTLTLTLVGEACTAVAIAGAAVVAVAAIQPRYRMKAAWYRARLVPGQVPSQTDARSRRASQRWVRRWTWRPQAPPAPSPVQPRRARRRSRRRPRRSPPPRAPRRCRVTAP